ncbi:hypothetical protein Q7P35_001890 [Cladosporium inversicolor]
MAWKSSALHLGQDIRLRYANWSPSIWLLAAPITIVTTNYLIHDRHQHFPYHLLIPQLLVAIAIRLHKRASDHGWTDFWRTIRCACSQLTSPTWTQTCNLAATISGVICLMASYQAFFHLPSVLCLAMVLGLAPACATIVCDFFLSPGRLTATRVTLLATCVFLIFLNDYRLTPPGFGITLLALGTHIAAHCFGVYSQQTDSPEAEDEPESDDSFLCTLLAAVLPLFAAAWISETPTAMGFSFGVAPLAIAFNAIVGGIALSSSDSLFMRPPKITDGYSSTTMSIEALALAGLVFLFHALTGRAIIISGWQVAAFAGAYLVASTASAYVEYADTAEGYLRMYHMPTWRKVLGLQSEHSIVGLRDSEQTDNDTRASRIARCSGKLSAWQIFRIALLSIALIGWVCIFYKALQRSISFSHREINPFPTKPAKSDRSFDIVVSYHDEALPALISTLTSFLVLPNVASLTQRVILYAKASDSPTSELQINLTMGLPPNTTVLVRELPNKGREGETYLHHILDNYDNATGLADHTMFLQAEMHDPLYMRPRITQYFVPQTGFLSLWHLETVCSSSTSCRDHSTWNSDPEVLESVFRTANNDTDFADVVTTYRGQFITSAPRIRANSKSMYEDLDRRFTASEEENPLWGYDLERLWGVVMQCPGGRRVGDRCPSLLSGMLGTVGEVEDCQCIDH